MSDPYNPQPGQFPAPGQSGFPQPGFNPPGFGQPSPGQPNPGQPSPGQPNFGQPNYGQPGQNSPIVGQEPPSKRSRGKMVGAVVGVVAIAAAGTFAFTQLRSNDSSGGASSPEEVGTDMTTALDNEDILGVVDLLVPGERETFRQPMIDLVEELKRLEITDETADLGKVGGFDISIDNVEVDARATNVDDVQLLNVTADASVSVNGDELPIGDFIIESVFGGDRPDIDDETTDGELDVTFATVEREGRWYVSLFYTAANSIYGGADIPEEGIAAVGADSPEGALDNLVGYTSNLDIENMIASLNPNEAEVLQRYAPLFLDGVQEALDSVDIAWEITDVEYSVDGSGDRRQVGIDGFHFEAQVEGETVEFDWVDGCLVGTTPQGEFDSCTALDDSGDSTLNDYLDDAGMGDGGVRQLIEDVRDTFSDLAVNGVVVDKVDGSWYVSPIGTGAETFLSVLRAVDRDDIETFIDDFSTVFEEGISMPEIALPDNSDDDTAVTIPDASAPDDSVSDIVSWVDCAIQYTETADITSCITSAVDSGEIDPTYIPASLLFPECGLAEYFLGFDSSSDDAATFLAMIEPGRQCVIDAAAAKGFDLLLVSPEFVYPDCFVQDNPYNYSEENEVDGYECVAAQG